MKKKCAIYFQVGSSRYSKENEIEVSDANSMADAILNNLLIIEKKFPDAKIDTILFFEVEGE